MIDRAKVIKGLEIQLDDLQKYADATELITLTQEHAKEILALLKEQEAVPCGEKMKAGDVVLDFYECGYCKKAIRKPWKYCPFCGKVVNWNGFDRKALV